MFVVFSSNLGCLGSIIVSLVGTLLLLFLLGIPAQRSISGLACASGIGVASSRFGRSLLAC